MAKARERSSRLDQRVTIQVPPAVEGAQDDHGNPTGAWTDSDVIWAEVLTDAGQMQLVADQLKPTQAFIVTIRRREIDTTKRLKWTDRNSTVWYLYPQSITMPEGPRSDLLTLFCTAGVR
jgi:head-tail adaptor